ncbi:MAG: type 1 glutamine amidotransferase [Phycisphaerales bacterium]|nr:type 1 glutamine amidotransferase [Phycisphaerales bacterium]
MSILVLEHSDRARCGRLVATLRDHGHRLDIRSLHDGDPLPSDLEGIDGVITMGGPMAPDDDSQPWMADELQLIRTAVEQDLPLLGICLGHQLLVRALGGTVERRPGGQRIGWHPIELNPTGREDPLLAGLPWQWTQAHWNSYQAATLPGDARVLATGPDGDIQVCKLGVRTYGFQCHPEIAPETMQAWIDDEPDVVRSAGTTGEALMAETASQWPSFERLTDRLFKACAMLLFPLEQRNLGIGQVTEIHH